jgi:hypothetical protein
MILRIILSALIQLLAARSDLKSAFNNRLSLFARMARVQLFGITDTDEAIRYIREIYLPMHHDLFAIAL